MKKLYHLIKTLSEVFMFMVLLPGFFCYMTVMIYCITTKDKEIVDIANSELPEGFTDEEAKVVIQKILNEYCQPVADYSWVISFVVWVGIIMTVMVKNFPEFYVR